MRCRCSAIVRYTATRQRYSNGRIVREILQSEPLYRWLMGAKGAPDEEAAASTEVLAGAPKCVTEYFYGIKDETYWAIASAVEGAVVPDSRG